MPILNPEGKSFATERQVLVIGAGACGCTAALAANERAPRCSSSSGTRSHRGSTSLSGGQIPAAGTKLQRAAGLLDDTPEILAQDILDKAHGECDHELARHIADESAKTVDWLVER